MKYHFCQSVDGAIRNWKKKEWESLAKSNNITVDQIKDQFHVYRFEGKKVIPIGECDNFSYENGCQGHKTHQKEQGE